MQVNSYSPSSYLAEITQKNNKSQAVSKGNSFPSTQDTVSISAEAFSLAKDLYLKSRADFAKQQMEDQSDTANAGGTDTNSKKSADAPTLKDVFHSYLYDSSGRRNKSVGANGAPSAESDAEQQIKAIEKQIETLQGEIEAVASSDMPDVAKEAQIGGIQSQISELVSQKSILLTGMREAAVPTSSASSTSSTSTGPNPFMALK